MPEEQRYLTGCKTCEEYKAHFSGAKRQPDASPILGVGSVEVEGKKYSYEVIESRSKAAQKHLIMTTLANHVGAEMIEVRAALNAEATRVAADLLGENYRIIVNSGNAASMTHYHAHLISPGEGEKLTRAVANVQKVIEGLNASEELKKELDKALLQQK